MTAYEIASNLEAFMSEVAKEPPMIKYANYIRKQADRIEMLNKECAAMREQLRYLESQIYGGVAK